MFAEDTCDEGLAYTQNTNHTKRTQKTLEIQQENKQVKNGLTV